MFDKILQKWGLSVFILALLCAYLFFFDLGKLPLTDPDETFYAQTAKEMLQRREWVTPYLYGKPQFEKPILFYWLVEASFKVFGVNEFAARLPSAVFGLIGVIALYLLGSLLFNRRAGFLSALALATCVEYIILSRACITDMVLTTILLLGFLFFFYGYLRHSRISYVLSAAFMALAVLTKGPVYLVFGAFTIIAYLLLKKDIKALFKMPLLQMAAAFILIAAPWYLVMYKIHGKAFIDVFFGFHNVNRFLEAEHKIGSQFYYNIPIVFGGFFPWSVFLPFGLWHIFRKSGPFRGGAGFVLTWFVVIFGFFTVSSTKLPTYIFPCFMSLALIVGVLWDDFLGMKKAAMAGTRVSFYLLAAIVAIGSCVAPIIVKNELPCALFSTSVSVAFLAFGILLSLVSFMRGRFVASFMLVVYAVAIFLLPLNELLLPSIERYETSKEVSLKLREYMMPGDRLGSESNYLGGLAFYTGVAPVDLDMHHNEVVFLNSKERIWAVIKEKNHRQLYDPVINREYVKPSYLVFTIGKRAIVTNEPPRDGRYLIRRERPQ